MVQRKVTYRLDPTAAQLAALEHQRWVHCLLWNEALAERHRAWAEQQLSGREPAEAWRAVRPSHLPDDPARPVKRETHAIA
ncbi:MAG: helix-turn-helix domain-containing protein [Halorhodospira sp.]